MKKIIITIVKKSRDESEEIRCDIEVPTEIRADILTKDIMQVLEGYCKKPMKADGDTGLYLCRREKALEPEKTFAESEVRNGDIILITEN